MSDITIRAADEAQDDNGVAALAALAAAVDGHEPLGEHKFLRVRRGDDLASALVAVADDRIVGYAHALAYPERQGRRASCELVVHPESRRQGIGKLLLERTMADAREHGASRLDLWAYNAGNEGSELAGGFGFVPTRRILHLHRHAAKHAESAPVAQASIRHVRPGIDDETWLALNNRIFAGHPENGQWTPGDLAARMAQPWFDSGDMLLVDVAGRPAGICWIKVEERGADGRVGELYVFGVAPEHRGQGLAKWLMARALDHLRLRDVGLAAVYVDQANERAVRLYEEFGFHYHHVDVCYSLDLAARVTAPVAGSSAAA